MYNIGIIISLAIAILLLVGTPLLADTRWMAVLAVAGMVVLLGTGGLEKAIRPSPAKVAPRR